MEVIDHITVMPDSNVTMRIEGAGAVLRGVVRYEVQSRDVLELKTADRKTIVARRRH